jgi:hypothetical protein
MELCEGGNLETILKAYKEIGIGLELSLKYFR